MAKSNEEKEKKKDKKERKEKRSDKDGVHKSKRDKEKKDKKELQNGQIEAAILPKLVAQNGEEKIQEETFEINVKATPSTPLAIKPALVPFADPLADEKTCKKVLKSVKKAARARALKRGVKEVVKALRKSPSATSQQQAFYTAPPLGVVILAGDISPMDVISHIPVLCEDHGVPYIFVPSRAELGAAGSTKRPTSVMLVSREKGSKPSLDRRKKSGGEKEKVNGEGGKVEAKEEGTAAKKEEEDEEDWEQIYGELVKVVRKASKNLKI